MTQEKEIMLDERACDYLADFFKMQNSWGVGVVVINKITIKEGKGVVNIVFDVEVKKEGKSL